MSGVNDMSDDSSSECSQSEDDFSFEKRIEKMVTAGYSLVGICLGSELGLFTLMARRETPISVEELAKLASCKTRYIKEWLHYMVVNNVLETDVTGTQFSLPRRHAPALVEPQHALWRLGRSLPDMFSRQKLLLRRFKDTESKGKTDSSRSYHDRKGCQVDDDERVANACYKYITGSVTGIKSSLVKGIQVGHFCPENDRFMTELAFMYSKCYFVGFHGDKDTTDGKGSHGGKNNMKFFTQDICNLAEAWTGTFHLIIVMDSLQHISDPNKGLAEIFRCLRPDGQLCLFDTYTYTNPYLTCQNPVTRRVAQEKYPHSLCCSLPRSTDTNSMGMCPGIEALSKILKKIGFIIEKAEMVTDTSKVAFVCKKLS